MEPTLSKILVCPQCKKDIQLHNNLLRCHHCHTNYILHNDIPIMFLPSNKPFVSGQDLIHYHLEELKIALDPDHISHSMPAFQDHHQVILDLGCGIGQIFEASGISEQKDKVLLGIDPDYNVLAYGKKHHPNIYFINGSAEALPIQTDSVDLVFSRVTLPYTDINQSMQEIHRILKPGGEVWITLHGADKYLRSLKKALKKFKLKDIIFNSYVLFNGLMFHYFGWLFRFPFTNRIESFQTAKSMNRVLKANHFHNIEIVNEKYFLVKAKNFGSALTLSFNGI